MKIEISDEYASALSLYLKRITYDDAFRRTDCGFTAEKRKEQAYRFLDGVSDVEKAVNEELHKKYIKENTEQETQGRSR